jgi:hypothetical protein
MVIQKHPSVLRVCIQERAVQDGEADLCRSPSGADLAFMSDVMAALEEGGVAAPGPIEQRWSASSSADMSPASSPDDMSIVHSWVGIIMYLPEDDQRQRAQITQRQAHICFDPLTSLASKGWRRMSR